MEEVRINKVDGGYHGYSYCLTNYDITSHSTVRKFDVNCSRVGIRIGRMLQRSYDV